MADTQERGDAFEQYEDDPVVDATIAIHKAGDGLSTALQVEPPPLHRGDTVYVILETQCRAVSYVDSKRIEGAAARQHKLVTIAGAIVGERQVAKMMKEAKKEQAEFVAREKERRDAEKGTIKLDGTDLDSVEQADNDHGLPE